MTCWKIVCGSGTMGVEEGTDRGIAKEVEEIII